MLNPTFFMTIDGYKRCRILRKHELNIRYINNKYPLMKITVPVAEWLAYSPVDSYIPGSSRVGRNFIFQKISWPKGHWNVPAIPSTEWYLNGDWNATEIHLTRHHSVAIQPPFNHLVIDAVAKQSKKRSGILKRNEEPTSSVFHFAWLCFN